MVKEFSAVAELKSIREQKSRLSEREQELAKPLLSDLALVPVIYEWFKEILANQDFCPRIDSPHQRKKFIFIILFLFSPSTLAGGRVPNKIREELSKVVCCYPSYISHNIENVLFMFQQYKDFRQEIDYLYTEIINRLKVKGLINENAGV